MPVNLRKKFESLTKWNEDAISIYLFQQRIHNMILKRGVKSKTKFQKNVQLKLFLIDVRSLC